MIYNPNNTKYTSALEGQPCEARLSGELLYVFRPGRERNLDSQKFSLRPVYRNTPDIDRLGRAILEMAMRQTA